MASLTPRNCGLQMRRQHKAPGPPCLVLRAQSGRAEPFNESAAQVKRLINRDRKEFMGNDDDILDKYQTEFDATPAAAPAAVPPPPARKAQVTAGDPQPKAASTATLPKPAASNPFGSSSASSNPFGAPAPAQPFRSLNSAMEPAGLRPDMGPDPIIKEKGFNLFENITITQVVIVCSFTLIISLMIGTAYFVYSVGGIRLNGV